MNVHDSEKVASLLGPGLGWTRTDEAGGADLIFFNTCAVRQKAEDKLYHALDRLGSKAAEKRPIVVVGGCVAQLQGERLRERFPAVDILIGPRSLHRLPELIAERGDGQAHLSALDTRGQEPVTAPTPPEPANPARALVTIMEGCNQVCSFCVVPRTRGTETCHSPEDVEAEVTACVSRGRAEIMLLGQTVNAYRHGACTFGQLLRRVGSIEGVRRLRFVTSHPRHVDEDLATAFATVAPLCPHFHLPVQSGSDRLLTAMRRGYDRRTYVDKIAMVRRHAPDIALWTDIIVGYPGETEEDFQQTLDLLSELRFSGVFGFTYSPRPGTTAERLADDVPPSVKSERLSRLNTLQQERQALANRGLIGSIQDVLIESVGRDGRLEGRTPHYRIVHCGGGREEIGRYRPVRITGAAPNSLVGEIVGESPNLGI